MAFNDLSQYLKCALGLKFILDEEERINRMTIEALFWLVGFILFQPLHLGMPLLYLFMYADAEGRVTRVKRVIVDGVLSSAVVFSVAAWFSDEYLYACVALIVLSFPLPWLRIGAKHH